MLSQAQRLLNATIRVPASSRGAKATLQLTGKAQIFTHLQAKPMQGKFISDLRVYLLTALPRIPGCLLVQR